MYKRKTASIVKRDSSAAGTTSSAMMMKVDSAETSVRSQSYESTPVSMDTSPDPPTPIKSPSNSQSQSQPGQQRSVGSLVLLTQKFVDLVKANEGSIDLKAVLTRPSIKYSTLTSSKFPLCRQPKSWTYRSAEYTILPMF